jgi:hypothetical protein
MGANEILAEREGFEPPIRLPVCRISSAVLSTTQPPLQILARPRAALAAGILSERLRPKRNGIIVLLGL